MKRRIGTIKGKPIIKGGGTNTLADNEILVENNKIIVRENGQLKELCNNSSSDSDSTIDLDTIITGFYLGTKDLDSSYSYEIVNPKIDISEHIHKESNGVYITDFQTLYNLKGSNNLIIITTNIDNCCFTQFWTNMFETISRGYWYLYPEKQNHQYEVTMDTLLPAIIISYKIT